MMIIKPDLFNLFNRLGLIMELIIYRNTDEFLKQMEYLEQEYNNISYFYKFLRTKEDFLNQINYLKKVEVIAFNGFTGKRLIKITIKDSSDNKYCIQYKFTKGYAYYSLMIRFLRQMEQVNK